jgi:hypothetical protein
MKTLRDISWQVDEPTYREDPALSYSTLARFAREGFNNLDNLYEKVDTPSLTFGSAVDAIVTGGQEEFDRNFFVAEFPPLTESVEKMVKALFERHCTDKYLLGAIPDSDIISLSEELKYQLNWKPETRAKVIKEQGAEYYSLLHAAGDRKVVNTAFKEDVDNCVSALRNSAATSKYFNPFDNTYEKYYQLKFKATLNGVDYRCMADLLVVDHKNKVIYPIDLKTSSHTEWDFFESFVQWNYQIQARLYWRIIRYNLDQDDTFKDYELADYRFIVVNKKTLTPLVWKFDATKTLGTMHFGENGQIEMRDPEDLGKELSFYLSSRPKVPIGINLEHDNNIIVWLNKKK